MNGLAGEPTSEDKTWGGLGYVGLVCCALPTLVLFFLKKDESDYIKFHMLQALALFVISLVVNVVLMSLMQIPVLGMVFGLLSTLFGLAATGYWIYLMVMAFTGKETEIPYVGQMIRTNLMQ